LDFGLKHASIFAMIKTNSTDHDQALLMQISHSLPLLWTCDELKAATGGDLVNLSERPIPKGVETIGFDSRSLGANALFLALKSLRDGHDFVETAFVNGAVLALTEKPLPYGPCLVVDNVQNALNHLGVAARKRATMAQRVAITGSVGKTSVTQMVRSAIMRLGQAHAAVKSFNNHIGVPLTLALMPKDTQRAAFELGMNHAGEIGPLSQFVNPYIGVITHVAGVHTENFPDGEQGVMKAKAEIFEGIIEGGRVILPIDSPWFDELKQRAAGFEIITVGQDDKALYQLTAHRVDENGALVEAQILGQSVRFRLQHRALHQAMNALMALAILDLMGVDRAVGLESLSGFEAQAGRGLEHRLAQNIVLIDESYNANPVSMVATIQALINRPMGLDGAARSGPKGRKLVLMSDMLELGCDEKQAHRDLSFVFQSDQIDGVFLAGPLMAELASEMQSQGLKDKVLALADRALDLVEPLKSILQENDVLLIKGSNGSKAHEVVKTLIETDQRG